MPSHRLRDQTIALAGLTQSACLTTHLAWTGQAAEDSAQTIVGGLFETHPKSAESVYGGLAGIAPGLTSLVRLLRVPARHEREQWSSIRCMLDMIVLSGQLMRREDMLDVLDVRLRHLQLPWQRLAERQDEVYAQIASLYRDTLSALPHRITIAGQRSHLSQPSVANRIRALLLGGVRSAVLWRQLGGRRHMLLLRRRRIIKIAEQLL